MRSSVLALAASLLTGCAPLRYIERHPVAVPTVPPIVPLVDYRTEPDDCPAYAWSDAGGWSAMPWRVGGETSTIPPGMQHPAANARGEAICLHVAVPPGAWIQANEARERFDALAGSQLALLDYIKADRALDEAEQAAIVDLVRLARQRQGTAFVVGAGLGVGVAGIVFAGVAGAVLTKP